MMEIKRYAVVLYGVNNETAKAVFEADGTFVSGDERVLAKFRTLPQFMLGQPSVSGEVTARADAPIGGDPAGPAVVEGGPAAPSGNGPTNLPSVG